jgi:multicomponent Na+:H+ antiporter subunit G
MVGRAGYRTKHLHRELLTSDDLEAVVQKAAGQQAAVQEAAGQKAADKAAREDSFGDGSAR